MKLIVITKDSFFADEALWINQLMSQEKFILHLRKPSASETDVEALLQQIDSIHYGRIVLHDHFPLAAKYQLMGVHLNSRNPKIESTDEYWQRCSVSRSCHSLQEIVEHKNHCNYMTLSPVFNSISKQGYSSAFTTEELNEASNVGIIDHKVFALGGITSENITLVANLGFGGAALLGAIWNQPNIDAALIELQKLLSPPTYKVLTIAGSDPSGGAGVQADIKTITSLGGYAASAITALTVQNTLGVQSVFAIPPSVVSAQIAAVMDDIEPQAVKIGMVKDLEIVRTIAQSIKQHSPSFVVFDPVMISTSGHRLIDDNVIECIEKELIPLVNLITPNMHEAECLARRQINDIECMEQVAKELASRYLTCVLVKGGHLDGNRMCDILAYPTMETQQFEEQKIDTHNLHGTGCTLSSAIATYMAQSIAHKEAISNQTLSTAIQRAKHYVTAAIQHGSHRNIGKGNGPLWHLVYTEN